MNEVTATQEERGKTYGKFEDHSVDVEAIMEILQRHALKKETIWPKGFKIAAFYMVSKLVRLCASPDHEDSALDLGSYADLWLKVIRESK